MPRLPCNDEHAGTQLLVRASAQCVHCECGLSLYVIVARRECAWVRFYWCVRLWVCGDTRLVSTAIIFDWLGYGSVV